MVAIVDKEEEVQIVFLGMPILWSHIQDCLVRTPHFQPIWRDRLQELGARHHIEVFPRPEDRARVLEKVLLCPGFYADCSRRIESAPEYREGRETWILSRILCEGATEIVDRISHHLTAEESEADFSATLLSVYSDWQTLSQIISCAFPSGEPLEETHCGGSSGVSLKTLPQAARDCQRFHERLHPCSMLDELVGLEPRVVFLLGSYPKQLPLAAMFAHQLRARLPRTSLVLYQSESSIYSSLAQVREDLLAGTSLSNFFDATTLFADIQDWTLCEIVERLASGEDRLGGIENLVCWENGSVRYEEPAADRVANYLRHTHLGNLFSNLRPDSGRGTTRDRWRTAHVGPNITAAKQTCYWDRCSFCPTSSQSWVKKDPYLERRAEETAELLIRLAQAGPAMPFVGREVVPPQVLKGLVRALKREKVPPLWSFEGKFESFYTQAFVESLAAAGCRGVIFGLETPSDRLNASMDKHQTGLNIRRIEGIIASLDDAGVSVHVNTIFDLPGASEEDFQAHRAWLKRMFEKHRFFHFNTNSLRIMPGSRMARRPGDFGLAVSRQEDFLHTDFPAGSDSQFESETIWEEVFGAPYFRGAALEPFHIIYHEATCTAFWDAASGRNYFQAIRRELTRFQSTGELKIRLAEPVEVIESESEGMGCLWLASVGGTGGWARVTPTLWKVIEKCEEEGCRVLEALDSMGSELTRKRREQALRSIRHLLALDMLQLQ